MKVLVLNSGSSSIKCEVFDMQAFTSLASGTLDDIGTRGGHLVHRVRHPSGEVAPLEGLVMGTHSGDVDPGAILYLLRDAGMAADDVDAALRTHGGLEGLCGDSDIREVLRRAALGDADAALAHPRRPGR